MSSPVLVDLVEKYKFFLPECQPLYSDSKIISHANLTSQQQKAPKIYQFLGGMIRMLDNILQAILVRKRIQGNRHEYPIYNLLHWALSLGDIDRGFYSLYCVATEAHNFQWDVAQISEAIYDTPELMTRDRLKKFVLSWEPADLVMDKPKPHEESLIMRDALQQIQSKHIAKRALKILRNYMWELNDEEESTLILEYVEKIESLLREFEVHLFKFSGLLLEAINSDDENFQEKLVGDGQETALEIQLCLRKVVDASDRFTSRHDGRNSMDFSSSKCIEMIELIRKKSKRLRESFGALNEQVPVWLEAAPEDRDTFGLLKRELRFIQELGEEFHLDTISIQDEFFDLAIELLSDRNKFEDRPQQKKYAECIRDVINIGGTYAVEAGTGTGKTLGYLIPACEHVRINEKRQVIVATATNNLTDQIVTKEWRTITGPRNSLYQDLKIAILKGKNNYLCVTAVVDLFKDLNRDMSYVIKKTNWSQRLKLQAWMIDPFVSPNKRALAINHTVMEGNKMIGRLALTVVEENQANQSRASGDEENNLMLSFQDEEGYQLDKLSISKGQTACYYIQLDSEPKGDIKILIASQQAGIQIKLLDHQNLELETMVPNRGRLGLLYVFLILSRKGGRWDSTAEFYSKYPEIAKIYPLDAENKCKTGECHKGMSCIYPQALRKAQEAHIVITNHHKLARLDAEIQERASVCIIDEADQFPGNLRSALTETLKPEDIRDFIRRLAGTEGRRGFVGVFKESIEKLQSFPQYTEKLQGIERACHAVNEIIDCRDILNWIERACQAVSQSLMSMTFAEPDKDEKRWRDLHDTIQETIVSTLEEISMEMVNIETCLGTILQYCLSIRSLQSRFVDRLKSYIDEAKMINDLVRAIIEQIEQRDCTEYLITMNQKNYKWSLNKIPFNIGAHVNNVTRNYQSVIFTSATVFVNESTELFELELFDEYAPTPPFTGKIKIDSPFSYDSQVNAAVTPFIPEFVSYSPEEFNHKVMETIALLAVAMEGRTLVLFPSWEDMKEMHSKIEPILDDYQIPLLIQDQSGSSEAKIETFADMEQSVLFGTKRFWSGADFPGNTLSQLIIIRLPNAPMRRAMVRESQYRWNDNRFRKWYNGNTHRSLRQGFGRLIRRKNDRGLFILMDYRIKTHSNMQKHQRAIPVVQLTSEFGSAVELANWGVKSLGLSPELVQREINLEMVYQDICDKLVRSGELR
ncbi:MAG: ATP-dependent DNA helicase [Bacteroidetes bacterium]|nr:ATP-dependent DNA helicase [Bacteroidota bacterium]